MLFRILKLSYGTPEMDDFHKSICTARGRDIPLSYLANGSCYGIIRNGAVLGGFCLLDAPPLHLKAVAEIPDILYNWHIYEDRVDDLCEITGIFVKDRRLLFVLLCMLVWRSLTFGARQYAYCYPVRLKEVRLITSYGDPQQVFTGVMVGGTEKEHVEILTKWGIVKILFNFFSWRKAL